MSKTSISLLGRLHCGSDADAWEQLVATYSPLLQSWLIRLGMQDADRDDITQDVLLFVSRSIKSFEHNGRTGAFRAWLRQALVHRVQQFWQRRERQRRVTYDPHILRQVQELEDPDSAISQQWNEEHDRHVVAMLLALARPHFTPSTWDAFEGVVLRERSPRDVAAEMGLTVNAVFVAKSRVLAHLRRNGGALIE